jgi:hypothetical protein
MSDRNLLILLVVSKVLLWAWFIRDRLRQRWREQTMLDLLTVVKSYHEMSVRTENRAAAALSRTEQAVADITHKAKSDSGPQPVIVPATIHAERVEIYPKDGIHAPPSPSPGVD